MKLKTVLILVFVFTIGIILTPYLISVVLTARVIAPLDQVGTIQTAGFSDFLSQVTPFGKVDVEPPSQSPTDGRPVTVATDVAGVNVRFINADIQKGWIPWIIKQVSILIGALSLCVFFYAGINLIINGDNEEEFGKSIKILVFAVVGIALAALSYTLVANILALFTAL